MNQQPGDPDMGGGGPGDLGCGGCPGQGLSTSDAICVQDMGAICELTCRGENYDIDGDPRNGCEMAHTTPPGHTPATAGKRPSLDCFDSSTDTIMGFLLSDARTHTNPIVDSFNPQTGSAPDFYRVTANGGAFCVNDYDVTFSTSGGGTNKCYQITIITNKKTQSMMASGSDLVKMSSGSGSYDDGTDVYFKVEKICTPAQREVIRYTIGYHL